MCNYCLILQFISFFNCELKAISAYFNLVLAHLSQSDMVSFCNHFSSSCWSVEFLTSFPHKPLSQFHQNFTGMFLRWSPLKIVQRIEFHALRTLVAMAMERKNTLKNI
jgi:hypothetical protein